MSDVQYCFFFFFCRGVAKQGPAVHLLTNLSIQSVSLSRYASAMSGYPFRRPRPSVFNSKVPPHLSVLYNPPHVIFPALAFLLTLTLSDNHRQLVIKLLFACAGLGLAFFLFRLWWPRKLEWEVEELWIYPIKSCKGISSRRLEVGARGFKGDRIFVICAKDEEKYAMVTQRECPKLALLGCELNDVNAVCRMARPGGGWIQGDDLAVPISVPAPPSSDTFILDVFRAQIKVADCGDVASKWLNRYLNADKTTKTRKDYRLCRLLGDRDNVKDDFRWSSVYSTKDIAPLVDSSQFLVTFRDSINDLNDRLKKNEEEVLIPMESFRPNIVLKQSEAESGVPRPWNEDTVADLEFGAGNLLLRTNKPCQRCAVSTVDQSTGVVRKSLQPLRELNKFRKPRDKRFYDSPIFGLNMSVMHEGEASGERVYLTVGDRARRKTNAVWNMLNCDPVEKHLKKEK